MRSSVSYIKDTDDFLSKVKNLKKVPDNSILVTVDIVGLYPSISLKESLEILTKQLGHFDEKRIHTKDLLKLTKFVLKNNYFEFNSNVKHKIFGTAIRAKVAHYMCVYIDYMENQFSKINNLLFLSFYRLPLYLQRMFIFIYLELVYFLRKNS